MTNLYQVLGVRDRASEAEVKRAYRQLVKIYHPDINPEPVAQEKIVEITNAYDILSDPIRKNEYDVSFFELDDYKYQKTVVREEDLARKAYKEQKAQQEQERLAKLFKLKERFYAIQRICCFLFLTMGIIYSIDFFYHPAYDIVTPSKVVLEQKTENGYYTTINTDFGQVIETERGLYDHYDQKKSPSLRIYYSSIFKIESRIGVIYNNQNLQYKIYGNLHEFENIITYLLMIISLIIIKQNKYSDWALTLAFIPFFIAIFLVLAL